MSLISQLTRRVSSKCTRVSPLVNITRRNFSIYDEKGAQRQAGRTDGLLMTKEQIEEAVNAHMDEEGAYTDPKWDELPYMTRREVLMNLRVPPLGIEPPPFGEEQYKEITEKTTITREGIDWCRKFWMDDSEKADEKNFDILTNDMVEMHKKGVSFGTINLWIDYVTGADVGFKYGLYNNSWARIDS